MADEASDLAGSEQPGVPDGSAQVAGGTTSKPARRFTARSRIILAIVVIVIVAVVVPLALGASSQKLTLPPAAKTPGGGPTLLMKRLWNISQGAATSEGDANAGPRQGVGPVAYDKTDALLGGGPLQDASLVYLLEIRGTFVCGGCSGPRGASAPHGIAITLLLNPATLEGLGGGIGSRWLDLASLGKPFALPHPPDGAQLWKVPPDFSLFLGSWGNRAATLQLNAGTASSLRWGGHEITFQLTALASAHSISTATTNGGLSLRATEAIGDISNDNVGLDRGSRIVLRLASGVGDSYLVVSTTPAANTALPAPLACKRMATGLSCQSNG
jgi:hypothetical protein